MTQNIYKFGTKKGLFQEKRITLVLFAGLVALVISLLFLALLAPNAKAYEIKDTNVKLNGDFVLSPAKLELDIKPGETATRTLSITNRINKTMKFGIDIEDFEGSQDPDKPVVLLGGETGPYSLKDYLHPDTNEFTLKPGQRMMLPIRVTLPKDAEPGGLYGSILVHNIPNDESGGGAKLVQRLGALFFIRVAGDADESGLLQDFRLAGNKSFFTSGPYDFEFIYKNTGNVHMIPYGTITIYNTFGKVAKTIEVDPYFALPNAVRYREMKWDPGVLLGHYKAVLQLNRGYGDDGGIVDSKTVTFWVMPWKWILSILLGLFILIFLIYFFTSKLEIRVKK